MAGLISFRQIKSAIRLSPKSGQPMRRRLIFYMLSLCFLLMVVSICCMQVLGYFSIAKKLTSSQLSTQLSVYEKDISSHYDRTAALGIQMSRVFTQQIETELSKNGLHFADLNNNGHAISNMENKLYDTLYQSMMLADCSGGYFLLNATVNTGAPANGSSHCGLYLKIANVNAEKQVSPKILLFRGSNEVGKCRNIGFHNKWALEFDTASFPDYDFLMEKANGDLNSCFLFTPTVELPETWEKVMLLCVPVVGSDGTVYGICGYEISSIYFKILHEQPTTAEHLTGLLCEKEGGKLLPAGGMENGAGNGYFASITAPELSITKTEYFHIYESNENAYVGFDKDLRISPLNHNMAIAVMIPKADFDAANRRNIIQTSMIILFLLAFAYLGCFWISHKYVAPILSGLEKLKAKDTEYTKTNILEIDDLLEFLSRQDEKSEAEMESLKQALELNSRKNADPNASLKTNLSSYDQFVQGIATLSPAEKAVFDLYLEGHTAKEITEILCLSINTIKTHNKRIFMKLNVTSRKELMFYIQMMEEAGANDLMNS